MSVVSRARASGRCPPSLLRDEPKEDDFEAALSKVLDANDLILSPDRQSVEEFDSLLKMADSTDDVPGDDAVKSAILTQRRCIILAIVGSTPVGSSSLTGILEGGYLNKVKGWLNDTLADSTGGVDLLLHLLTNITGLPVTKSIVKESGMGKMIGSVGKHKICVGTPNETAIKDRLETLKDAWQKSVKVHKEKDPPSAKRTLDSSSSSPIAKKPKVELKKKAGISGLLDKIQPANLSATSSSTAGKSSPDVAKKGASAKSNRVKWADHFGDSLKKTKILEDSGETAETNNVEKSDESWSDRRRRDRLREKELLSQVKKAKLSDDDMEMEMAGSSATRIKPAISWRTPTLLPERPDAPPVQVNSQETANQAARMLNVQPARFSSESSVPSSPAPMTEVEQALDMTQQSSAVTKEIPFFVPSIPTPPPAPAAPVPAPYAPPANSYGGVPQPPPSTAGATVDFVQSLGLPVFLAGQNIQALQTLANTPSLLGTFVDGNGMYDQTRLVSLVQTLSQGNAPNTAAAAPTSNYQQPPSYGSQPPQQSYGNTSAYGPGGSTSQYGQQQSSYGQGGASMGSGLKNGFRGDKNFEGNLHLSGYGLGTTQSEIISLFLPYVRVDEVVMKGTFCFVNTSDAAGAQRAREALSGALLGGQPVRINMAQRKANREGGPPQSSYGRSSNTQGSYYGNAAPDPVVPMSNPMGAYGQSASPASLPPPMGGPPMGGPPMGAPPGAGGDYSNVRDDRGNPATKNLFVAGYGQSTSEQQVREIFGQHAQLISIIMKGTFSFVNTTEKGAAIRAREALSGQMLNGGVLRINFAKETGRLGTSFDLTYGRDGGGRGGGAPPPRAGHYGRF